MDLAETAFRRVWKLAEADGGVSEDERRLLERYRRALGIDRQGNPRRWKRRSARSPSRDEAADILKMMARVATVDGKVCERERAWLEQVGVELGIGRVQFAEILVAVEHEMQRRLHWRQRLFAAAGALLLVTLVGLTLQWSIFGRSSGAQMERMEELRGALQDLSEEAARGDTARVRATWRDPGLRDEIGALEEVAELSPDQSERLNDLRRELAARTQATSAFKQINDLYGSSIVLIAVHYELVAPGKKPHKRMATGTGFFVSPAGLIATNRHVIHPWTAGKPDVTAMLAKGYRVDERALRISVWAAGSLLKLADGGLDLDRAFSTRNATLSVEGSSDEFDLAVLRAAVPEPVVSLPLNTNLDAVAMFDDVVALGFPGGAALLEGNRAFPMGSKGVVRNVEASIFIDAPIVPGNSGGPLFNVDGEVIGVATKIHGDASLGACIPSRHLLEFLAPAAELVAAAEDLWDEGRARAARSFLALAIQRDPGVTDLRRIERLRARIGRGEH